MMNPSPLARLCARIRSWPFSSWAILPLAMGFASQPALADSDADGFWPQWRGPLASGVAPLADPPLTWSETSNVKWKTPIPGEGDSTPIVWDNRIFLLSAIATGKKPSAPVAPNAPDEVYRWVVLCLDRAGGKVLWQKTAREEVPHEGHQQNNTFASASPVTDGALLLAYFGSRGLHCYDFDGNLIWEKDFGKMKTRMGFGEGASPALSGDTVVVNWDTEGADFIAALDKQTGRELWRTPRDEATGWSTPLIVEFNGQKQVVVNASRKVRSYDLATGKEIWSCAGQTANAIPSPVAADGIVFLTSGFRGSALQAIRLGRAGDLTGTDAILSCFNAGTGEVLIDRERLEAIHSVYASPVSAK